MRSTVRGGYFEPEVNEGLNDRGRSGATQRYQVPTARAQSVAAEGQRQAVGGIRRRRPERIGPSHRERL